MNASPVEKVISSDIYISQKAIEQLRNALERKKLPTARSTDDHLAFLLNKEIIQGFGKAQIHETVDGDIRLIEFNHVDWRGLYVMVRANALRTGSKWAAIGIFGANLIPELVAGWEAELVKKFTALRADLNGPTSTDSAVFVKLDLANALTSSKRPDVVVPQRLETASVVTSKSVSTAVVDNKPALVQGLGKVMEMTQQVIPAQQTIAKGFTNLFGQLTSYLGQVAPYLDGEAAATRLLAFAEECRTSPLLIDPQGLTKTYTAWEAVQDLKGPLFEQVRISRLDEVNKAQAEQLRQQAEMLAGFQRQLEEMKVQMAAAAAAQKAPAAPATPEVAATPPFPVAVSAPLAPVEVKAEAPLPLQAEVFVPRAALVPVAPKPSEPVIMGIPMGQVNEMVALYVEGGTSQADLASAYKIPQTRVHHLMVQVLGANRVSQIAAANTRRPRASSSARPATPPAVAEKDVEPHPAPIQVLEGVQAEVPTVSLGEMLEEEEESPVTVADPEAMDAPKRLWRRLVISDRKQRCSVCRERILQPRAQKSGVWAIQNNFTGAIYCKSCGRPLLPRDTDLFKNP